MKRHLFLILVLAVLCAIFVGEAFSLSAESIVQLKTAGISDATIELLISEKSVETAAFSVTDIVAMKKAGLSDTTIQAAIRAGSFLRGSDPIVYGRAIRPVRLSSVEDIIAFHEAGFSDEVLKAVLTVVNPTTESERERAFDLLEGMNIRVDLRGE